MSIQIRRNREQDVRELVHLNCYAEANVTVDFLDQALKALQEETPEFCEALSQALIKADQLLEHCGAIVEEMRQIRLK